MRRLLLPATLLAVLCTGAAASAGPVGGQPAIDTDITGGPEEGAVIEDETPSFSFAATANGVPLPTAAFHCSVDGAAPVQCASPYELETLDQEGRHSFSVYAEEPTTGIVDPEPAIRHFFLEFEEDECEEVGEELEDEEGNVEICEEGGAKSPMPPEECLLRSARARVLTFAAHDRIRLVVRYTSFSPADVLVAYRLTGGRGPLGLGSARVHFTQQGLYRATERLSEAQAAKVRAAKRFTVTLDILGTPDYCHRFETRHLTIRKTVHNQVVWFQEGSIFGTKQ
jgi:hypothetical protein